jgi:exodeoxyribonuclease VII large subunit
VHDIEASYTLGLIEKQRQQTLARLVAENADIRKVGDTYLTPNKSRSLPPVLQKLAVISSKASAGLNDFKHTLEHNSWGYRFAVDEYYTEVQGEGNALSLRNTLIHIYKSEIPYDAIAIIRGGGAQTDFLLFDNYLVGQAIARFPIPVITGIGHQHNTSIADLMAHTQTKTPTEAAAFIIAHNRAFETQLLSLQQNILIKTQQLFASRQQALFTLQHKLLGDTKNLLHQQQGNLQQYRDITVTHTRELLFRQRASLLGISARVATKPALVLAHRSLALQSITNNLQSWTAGYLRHRKSELAHFESVVQLVSPEAILRRGFAMIRHNGQVVANAEHLHPGDALQIVLANTSLDATITNKEAVTKQEEA